MSNTPAAAGDDYARLAASLEDALEQADALGLTIAAAHISQALDVLATAK